MSSLSINMFWLNGGGYANDGGCTLAAPPVITVYNANFTVTKAVLIIDQLA